jgi:NAD(P)H-dependent FMN reductase
VSLLLISASLDAESRSRALLHHAAATLQSDAAPHEVLDLRDLPLPLCDGGPAYQHPNVAQARARVAAADGILAATPIYNYDANAALKNLIELTGQAWENKVVGFLCAAGGNSSYMSIMALANSLMLDFRCVIVPRFVYATGATFTDDRLTDPKILDRTAHCARATARLAAAVKGLGL